MLMLMLVGVTLGLLWFLSIDMCWEMCETQFMRDLLRISIVSAGNTPLGLDHFMPMCFN